MKSLNQIRSELAAAQDGFSLAVRLLYQLPHADSADEAVQQLSYILGDRRDLITLLEGKYLLEPGQRKAAHRGEIYLTDLVKRSLR